MAINACNASFSMYILPHPAPALQRYLSCLSTFCFVLIVDIILENNEDLAERLTKKAIPTKDYYDITGEDGHSK